MKDIFKDKNKRTIFLTLIFSFILILIGTTYAYFSWQSTNNPLVNITVEDIGDVIFKGGNEIKATDIGPVLDYNDGEITEFYIKKKMDNNLDININITPTILPDSIKDESFKVKLLSSTDNITYTEIKEDNFKDKETNIKFTLSTTELTNKLTYFKIIFYIDGNMLNSNNMKGQSFGAKIDISVDSQGFYVDSSNANAPVLAEGMVPIMYDNDISSWVKADYYNKDSEYAGYDYENKKWANAVMVTSATRETYMNADIGTIIPENDILAYFVWIPRYKYKLFNATYASSTQAQVIDVTFEKETSSTGTVTCTYASSGAETCQNKANGNWYTHPAFTMINASGNKTELKGIWVAKFEVSGSTTAPRVKPGVSSLRSITVANMYNTGKLFRSTDYITSNGINQSDSHMMKNIEWGAVAYLKQSKYGLGIIEIGANNNYNYRTGCGIAKSGMGSTSCNTYNTSTGMLASTTGNITGVYDMSGGAYEYVMGNYNKTTGSSGLTISGVPAEHIDIYSGSSVSASHLGDATGETAGWYSDYADFVNSSNPWFTRGGNFYDTMSYGGIFSFGFPINGEYSTGISKETHSFRTVLSIK